MSQNTEFLCWVFAHLSNRDLSRGLCPWRETMEAQVLHMGWMTPQGTRDFMWNECTQSVCED